MQDWLTAAAVYPAALDLGPLQETIVRDHALPLARWQSYKTCSNNNVQIGHADRGLDSIFARRQR